MGRISLSNAALAYLALVTLMSVVCFIFYGFDKRRAARGGRRVPEQTLHLLALLGGWPGALLGQRLFRHKTSKLPFLIVFWGVVVIHVAVVGGVAYALISSSTGRAAVAQIKHRSSGECNAVFRTLGRIRPVGHWLVHD